MVRGVRHSCAIGLALVSLGAVSSGCAGGDAGVSATDAPIRSVAALNHEPILFDFALYATNSIELQSSASISGGDLGVEQTGAGPFLFPGFALALREQARVEASHNIIAGSVFLAAGATVGDVQSTQLAADGATHGVLGDVPAMPEFPAAAPTMPAPTFLFVPTGTTRQIDDGANYGLVLVGDGAALQLTGGTYQAGTVWLSGSSRLEALAPSELHVSGMFSSGANSFIGVAPNATLDARNLRIEVSGTNGMDNLPSTMPGAVRFEAGDEVRALVLAPNGAVRVAPGSRVTGAIFARDIELGQGATVAFEGGFGVPVCRDECDDGNPCTIDVCVEGICSHLATADGTVCDDGNACTRIDACQAGTCVGTAAVTCAADDQCHDDGVCDPATGQCSPPAKADGVACDDGNACTQFDSCQQGACVGGMPVACAAADQCHLAGTCDVATGQCSNPTAADGTTCNDGNGCTRTDSCQAGACVGGDEVVCAALDQCHAPGTCDPASGACSNPALPDGAACSDGSECTAGDACVSGACVGSPVAIDDGNPCTADSCNPVAGTMHVNLAAGSACPDGDACNGAETCDGNGACVAGAPPDADDHNPCTMDSCDPAVGVLHQPVAEGTSCADDDVCNGAETCNADGACRPGTPLVVDDQNLCTLDTCDPVSGVAHVAVAAGTSCSDGNVCNGDEICDADGVCQPGVPLALDDVNPCTADGCDPRSGPTHTPLAAGTLCPDQNACNGDEICDGQGRCVAGAPAVIDDGDPCTFDTCDLASGIVHRACGAIDRTVSSNVFDTTMFLYSGDGAVQTGMTAGAIQAPRAAVIRGRVLCCEGTLLEGVVIAAMGHPELGSTATQADGTFDFAVNGGQPLVVTYSLSGYLPVQRRMEVPWQDFVSVADVALTSPDAQVSVVDLSAPGTQVARAIASVDANGMRRATLLFSEGTTATLTQPDQSTSTLETLHVRLTEYSVGPLGTHFVPGTLPPASAYTYAVELGADEATAGSSIDLSQPAALYAENFLGFPVGEIVPAGYFDTAKSAWIPAENGRVIAIVGITDGAADVDVDGNGAPDSGAALDALGITDAERQSLATLYDVGQSVWRLRVRRFTTWSANWGASAPADAVAPNAGAPAPLDGGNGPGLCTGEGVDFVPQRQALGKSVPLAGTPFDLHYESDRVIGRKGAYALSVPLSGARVPASLQSIQLQIDVAGRSFAQSFPALPDQTTSFLWDGRDAFGRLLQGGQPVRVRVGYTYDGTYQRVDRFGDNATGVAITGAQTREPFTLWKDWAGTLGAWDQSAVGIGGWSLSAHHVLDPRGRAVYLGNGDLRSGSEIPLSGAIVTAAGNGDIFLSGSGGPATAATVYGPSSVAVGSDGSFYIAESNNRVVRKVGADGIIRAFAGGGQNYPGDGAPATQVRLAIPLSVAVGRDGSVFIGDGNESFAGPRVRRVDANGIITTFAGNGIADHTGDGGPATAASIGEPLALAFGPDDSLYIAEGDLNRIRRVTSDGIITTIAGSGANRGNFNEGGRATAASINTATSVAVGHDGTVYYSDRFDNVVRAVTTDGIVRTIAGDAAGFSAGFTGDGGPATLAKLLNPMAVAAGPDGTIYVADFGNRIRAISSTGIISTIAGTGAASFSGEGAPAAAAALQSPLGMTVEPTGSLLFADFANNRVRRIASLVPGFSSTDSSVASDDGRELYVFDGRGRHQQTIDTLTQVVRYQFGYDATGKLASVTDADGNQTIIEHDASGNPAGITGPFGLRTPLAVDAGGYLTVIANPAGDAHQLSHSDGGLLATLTDPNGGLFQFGYDGAGLLVQESDPAGGSTSLSRTDVDGGFNVDALTALGRKTSYATVRPPAGGLQRQTTFPSGLAATLATTPAAVSTSTLADGTIVSRTETPDPRFLMFSPVGVTTTRTPAGLSRAVAVARTVTPSAGAPLGYGTFVETTTRNGSTWERRFDVAALTSTVTSPAGRRTFATFDSKGHESSTQVDGLVATVKTYDPQGRLSTIARGTRVQTFAYADDGMLRSITDALSQTTLLDRDGAGRITQRTLPGGAIIDFAYDHNGNLITVVPPGRPAHGLRYSPIDLLVGYEPPMLSGVDQVSTDYHYDFDRMLTDTFFPDGAAVHQTYDSAGRLSAVTLPTGTIAYGYDAASGKLATLSGPYGADLAFAFDGPLATDVGYSNLLSANVHFTYDANFRVCLETLNGAPASCGAPLPDSIAFLYDGDDLLIAAGALSIARDPRTGLVTGSSLGGISDAATYNGFGETATYASNFQGTSIFSESYDAADGSGSRDALGRIAVRTESVQGASHTYSYGYDPRGRLTDVTVDGASVAHYDYDANGNRQSKTGGGDTVAGAYDDQDRLLSFGTRSYAYGSNGELSRRTDGATGSETRYTYDTAGNLIEVDLPDGRTLQYVADGVGRRVGKRIDGTLAQGFVFGDGLRLLATTNGAGAVVSRFVYGSRAQVPEYMMRGGETYRLVVDQLGSVRLVVNSATGVVAERLDYDEFGIVTADTNPGFQPFGFAGGLYDPDTKLTRFGARDYDAEVGRWTAKNPSRFGGGGTNLYEYVGNDPINRISPKGE